MGRTLLEQVTVIFLAPTEAHKQAPPLIPPPHVLVEGCESPREASSQPDASQRCLLLLQHLH